MSEIINTEKIENLRRELLSEIGDDLGREGRMRTPRRVAQVQASRM